MARIVNFSLTMQDRHKVERDIAELREHFDLETAIGLYKEGKLQRWLKRNQYAEEWEQMNGLDEDDPSFTRALCQVLGVEVPHDEAVDVGEISDRMRRLNLLKDYTTNPYLLDLAENAAFSQEELEELLDEGADEIVLCNGRFAIPLHVRGTKYYGAGKAIAVIESDEIVDFERKYIAFENVKFDEAYQALIERHGTAVQWQREDAAEMRRRAEEQRWEEEARKRLEVERRAVEQKRQQLKVQKAPDILAETLGVLVHDGLFGGEKIWNWSHTADISLFSFRPRSWRAMKTLLERQGGKIPDEDEFADGEKILGAVVLPPRKEKDEGFSKRQWGSLAMMAAPLIPGIGWTVAAVGAVAFGVQALFKEGNGPVTMLFTDAAIRLNDTCIPYMVIEDAVTATAEDGKKVVRLRISGEENALDLPIGQYLDVRAIQLFLIAAINFYEEHDKRSPNKEEMRQFAQISLASMHNGSLLHYLS